MQTKVIEFTSVAGNWGKFLVCRMDSEWKVPSAVDHGRTVMASRGWGRRHLWVMDLETGEGAMFLPNPQYPGAASSQLHKHRIWVCVLFEPFLEWLFQQDLTDLEDLPSIGLAEGIPLQFSGYRRRGPTWYKCGCGGEWFGRIPLGHSEWACDLSIVTN